MSVTEQIQENVVANVSFQVLLKQYSDLKKTFLNMTSVCNKLLPNRKRSYLCKMTLYPQVDFLADCYHCQKEMN